MASWTKDWGPLAAKLAMMGLPALGTALGTIAGSNIPIVGSFLPKIGTDTGKWAAKAIADALGVKPDPEEILSAMESAPTTDVVTTLQGIEQEAQYKWPALALIAKEQTEQFKTQAEDTERARQWAAQLAAAGSPMQWAPSVLGTIVCLAFFALLGFRLFHPPLVPDPLLDGLTGSLGAAFMMVMGYYFGSNTSSKGKDATISMLTTAAAVEQKPNGKPSGSVTIQPPVTIKKAR